MVYISGPITGSGNLHRNIQNGIDVWAELIDLGFAPFCPHMNDFGFYVAKPFSWNVIIEVDLAILAKADALLRLPGKSKGADLEVNEAFKMEIPVFYNTPELIAYFKRRGQ